MGLFRRSSAPTFTTDEVGLALIILSRLDSRDNQFPPAAQALISKATAHCEVRPGKGTIYCPPFDIV